MKETSRALVGWRFILVLGYRGYPSYSLEKTWHILLGNSLGRGWKKPPRLSDHQLTVTGRNSANKKVGNPGCKKVEHLDIKQKNIKNTSRPGTSRCLMNFTLNIIWVGEIFALLTGWIVISWRSSHCVCWKRRLGAPSHPKCRVQSHDPPTNIAPWNRPSQKENGLATNFLLGAVFVLRSADQKKCNPINYNESYWFWGIMKSTSTARQIILCLPFFLETQFFLEESMFHWTMMIYNLRKDKYMKSLHFVCSNEKIPDDSRCSEFNRLRSSCVVKAFVHGNSMCYNDEQHPRSYAPLWIR